MALYSTGRDASGHKAMIRRKVEKPSNELITKDRELRKLSKHHKPSSQKEESRQNADSFYDATSSGEHSTRQSQYELRPSQYHDARKQSFGDETKWYCAERRTPAEEYMSRFRPGSPLRTAADREPRSGERVTPHNTKESSFSEGTRRTEAAQ